MPFDLYVFGPERYGLLELFNGSAPVNPDFLAQNQPLFDHHDFLDDGDHQRVPFLADVRRRLDHAIDRNALDFDIDAFKLLRANPFPEVPDPFCRLPLPTLFHWPEAVHLGDLMRL